MASHYDRDHVSSGTSFERNQTRLSVTAIVNSDWERILSDARIGS
jgi:hypothetical protein